MSFCTQTEPRYTCNQLHQIEGCPQCECTATTERLKLENTDGVKFLVCSKVAGWLLQRGVTKEEIGILSD